MGKPGIEPLLAFKKLFTRFTREAGKEQYLTYYFIAAHPGCREQDMIRLQSFCRRELGVTPEQVQVFTPTPSTYSTVMYWTGRDPVDGTPLFVERDSKRKEAQKLAVTGKKPPVHPRGCTTRREAGRKAPDPTTPQRGGRRRRV